MLFLIENIQLKKFQERILEILVTALLENIDLLLQFFMYMITKYFWSGSGILVCSGKTHFDPDKKWPDNPDDLTWLQRWYVYSHMHTLFDCCHVIVILFII